jgi:hypothetical protein
MTNTNRPAADQFTAEGFVVAKGDQYMNRKGKFGAKCEARVFNTINAATLAMGKLGFDDWTGALVARTSHAVALR